MKEIKLRQPVYENGKIVRWHYWGYKNGLFQHPMNIHESSLFTGIKDDRKDIYEGDVFVDKEDYDKEFPKVIEWEDGGFFLGDEHLIDVKFKEWMMIGNIYENPNLMK